jgi:tetratricopeptide (TPR) repeat protein
MEEAQAVLSRSLNANPGNWFLHYALGDLWLLKKDIPSALQSFHRASSLNPNDVNLAINLAKRLEQAGLIRSRGTVSSCLQTGPPKACPSSMKRPGSSSRRPTPPTAKEMVVSFETRGEGANEKDTVGWYHFQTGDIKTAEFYIREALLLDPQNPTIRAHLLAPG